MPSLTDEQLAAQALFLGAISTLFDEQFKRAASAEDQLILTAYTQTVGDEALTVSLNSTPNNGETWVIPRLTMHGVCSVNPSTAQAPVSGLFMVQYGTIVESLEDGQSVVGWNIRSRGIPLPSGIVVNATTIPGPPTSFAYCFSLTQSTPLVVSSGQTLRGVLTSNPGTPIPGPGAGSWGVLTAIGTVRKTR